jgi:hypothetical protein
MKVSKLRAGDTVVYFGHYFRVSIEDDGRICFTRNDSMVFEYNYDETKWRAGESVRMPRYSDYIKHIRLPDGRALATVDEWQEAFDNNTFTMG